MLVAKSESKKEIQYINYHEQIKFTYENEDFTFTVIDNKF